MVLGPCPKELNQLIKLLKGTFKIQEEGDLADYLGIKLDHKGNILTLTQPHLIASILRDLNLDQVNTKARPIPALTSHLLTADEDGDPFDESFDYRSMISKLNFLEKSTHPEIAYSVHQCAHFCVAPKKSHGNAVKLIGRYLHGTATHGLILQLQNTSFDCYVDASHAGEWNHINAEDDPTTAHS